MENPLYIIPDSFYNTEFVEWPIRYSNITAYTRLNTSESCQTLCTASYTPPKSEPYKEGYLDAASHYKYELKMLLNSIERADITVGCGSDKFQLAIYRARKAADEPLNQIQPEEEIF